MGRALPKVSKKMSGDLPSSLLITKNFVAASGEEKFYHLTKQEKGVSARVVVDQLI